MVQCNRLHWLDIVKGICIVQMVAFHTQIPYMGSPYLVNVTMPCFFLVSGWFFKEKFETLFKSFDKLIVPYITTAVLYNLLNGLLIGDFFSLPRSIWFLYVLFGVIIIYYVLCKIIRNSITRDIICLLFLIIGYFMHSEYPYPYSTSYVIDMHYNFEPLKIGSMCTMVFLYHIGNRLGAWYKMKEAEQGKKNMYFFIIISSVLFIIFAILNEGKQFYSVAFNNYEKNLLTVILLWIVNLAVTLLVSLKINKNKVLEYFGQYSLIVLCFHIFILRFSIDHPQHIISYPYDFLLILLLSPIVIYIVKRFIPYCYGIKPCLGGALFDILSSKYPKIKRW